MLMLRLEDVKATDIRRLVSVKAPETSTLDFKLKLPAPGEDGSMELMKDNSAMANCEGGDLVYGVADVAGAASKAIPLTGNADRDCGRIYQVADAIQPRITGLRVRTIKTRGGHFLVVRVPVSIDAPHSYVAQGSSPARYFAMRNGTTTTYMNMDQLRDAFGRSATLLENARAFFSERLARVRDGHPGRVLPREPELVVLCVPLSGMGGRHPIDIASLYRSEKFPRPDGWEVSLMRTMNLDGLLVKPAAGPMADAWIQSFRSGAVEAVRRVTGIHEGKSAIRSDIVARHVRDVVWMAAQHFQRHGLAGACVVKVALIRAAQYEFVANVDGEHVFLKPDRQHMELPDVWIDAFDEWKDKRDADEFIRPMLDLLWQSFNAERCGLYSPTGQWLLSETPAPWTAKWVRSQSTSREKE